MDIEKLKKTFGDRVEAWEKSQKGQQDPIEYELSLKRMIDQISLEILQESVGHVPKSKNEKKTSGHSMDK
jgi:hypothetical protein